jgi:hypothetical protein
MPPFTIKIETDNKSAKTGHVGAAAVTPQIARVLRRYLGSDEDHNVYATKIIRSCPPSYTKCIIYVDSQAAILGINKIQTVVDECQMVIEIIWVPGHEDVDGNEKADEAAKEAAKSEGNNPNIPTSNHKPLKSAKSVCIKQDVTNDWDESWQSPL